MIGKIALVSALKMIQFKVNNGDLISFIEKCACNGVVLITSTEKIKRNFFNYFYMSVNKRLDVEENEGEIVVKAVDSEEKRMFIKHTLDGVAVEEPGRFPITDVELMIKILKSIPAIREIEFKLDNNEITIQTTDDGTFYGYNLRQANVNEELQLSLSGSENGVAEWDSFHSFDEKENAPRITMPPKPEEDFAGGTSLYSCAIDFYKSELSKIVRTSVNLTKDQDIVISLVLGDKIVFKSGKKKDNIRSNMNFDKTIVNPIVIADKRLTNLHPIVEHLFDVSTFFLRNSEDNTLKFWIRSTSGNIELNFCSSSL